ncbi:serine hydrolase [Spirochaetia bacterium]|nr:serine hydrolase [Spirochaetia bacterium]
MGTRESGILIEGSGFSPKRLENVDACLQRFVDTNQAAGVGALLFRHGVEAYRKSFGFRDKEKKLPMENDSIYRIYSMTKTFTIVSVMTLYEKGLFKLHDPIYEFLPAFKNMKVAEHDSRGIYKLVDAKRPITFEHLFTMTSGLPYPGPDSPGGQFMAENAENAAKDAAAGKPWNTAKTIDAAAATPLCFHPGDYWMYGFSHDVLGRLIEVLSGKTLDQYLDDIIIKPLGLKDTAFYVPEEKQNRAAKAYNVTETGLKEATLASDPASPNPPAFESGGGGLCSTLDDVSRYSRMLLNSGKLDGERILSRKTIDLIRQNHVPLEQIREYGFPAMAGYGYGLGVRTMVDTSRAGLNGTVGEWAWDGMMGTWYFVDPAEDMTAVFLVQRMPGGNEDLPKRFMQTVYGAIDD